jgi:membrane associated rhomboid family serine protease
VYEARKVRPELRLAFVHVSLRNPLAPVVDALVAAGASGVDAVIAGCAVYLALADSSGPYLIGASGGTSGLIAAALMLGDNGRKHALWSPGFLVPTAIFAVMNVLLVLSAPYALGMAVSWEAHTGGYIFGALLMLVLPLRGYGWARS